jgi:DnaK suppressor protein
MDVIVVAAAIRLGYNTPLLCRTLPHQLTTTTQHQEPPHVAAKKPVKKPAKPAKKAVKPASKAKPATKSVKKPAAKKPVAKKPAPKKPVAKKPVAKKSAAAKPVKKPAATKAPAKKVPAKKPAPAVAAKKAAPAKSAPIAKPAATKPAAQPKPAGAQVSAPAKKGKASAPVAPPKPAPAAPAPVARPQGARAKAVVRNNLPEKVIPIQAVQTGVKLPKGYKPTSKEPYMSAFQMEYFRQRLLAWRADLVEESKQTIENLKEEVRDVGDEAERATRETENSLELRTRDRYRKLIGKIDDALKRIDDGIYGYCVDTGDEIGLERLEARLTAERTIDAQERWEHRQKQMGD